MIPAFLNSALLWFLPLAALPILLHLLTLHRLRTVELSTFRFLFDSYVQQRRRMRFLEALLAALRTLFLLFLVFVVCRPVVKHWDALFGGGSGREVVMLVDCSASMNARTAGTAAIDQAKSVAQKVAADLRGDDRLTLVRVTSQPQEVFSRFSSDAEAIQEHIGNLRASPSRANFFAALNQVFGPQSPARAKPLVYIFSDGQTGGWREVRDQPVDRLLPEGTEVRVIHVGSSEPLANRAVVGAPPRERRVIAGLPVLLHPRVVNFSATETLEVPVSVIVDEKEVARTTFTLKPGENRTRELIYVPRQPGVVRGRFEIPTDQFPDDDTFLFTLDVAPQVKVLIVNGHPAADPFENETLYLRTALSSTVTDDAVSTEVAELLPKEEFLRSLDVQEVSEGQLNPETLRDARVVILANCGGLNQQHFEWLRTYVAKGGGLLILPGDKVDPNVYNTQFFAVPGPQKERLTAASMGPAEGDAEKAATFERLAKVDFAHPVLTVFEDAEARYLSTAHFYRWFPLTIDTTSGNGASGNAWTLAEFSTGTPALVESHFGDGMVLLAAFPATPRWTNLPLKPEFVPLVLRLASHLEYRPDLETPSVVAADSQAEIGVSDEWAPAFAKVTDAAGVSQEIKLERSGSRLLGAFDGTNEKGFYAVSVMSGSSREPRGSGAFAVNLSPEESKFDLAGEDQFKEWLPGVELTMFDASAQAEQLHGAVGDEREIWRPLIALMFVIIIIEFLLATLGGGRTDAEEPQTVMQRILDASPGRWVGRMTGAGARNVEAS
jgi:hypothetical protein